MALPKVSVIIITHNRKESLLKALESVNYPSDALEIIVVDDASHDGTSEIVRRIYGSRLKIIRNEKEKFLSASRNIGFSLSTGTYILSMDDDCILEKKTILTLVKVMELDERIGVLGPAIYGTNGKIFACGARKLPFFIPLKFMGTKLVSCDFVSGIAGLFRREALLKADLWDSRNFPFNAEDSDICLRIRRCGYSIYGVPWAKVHHLNPSLLSSPNRKLVYDYGRSRILSMKRHLKPVSFIVYMVSVNVALTLFYTCFHLLKTRSLTYLRGVINGILTKI